MRSIYKLRLRLKSLFLRSKVEDELDEELRFHIEQQIQEGEAARLDAKTAVRAALLTFGGAEKMKEECRDKRRINFTDHLVQDIRFAIRMLRKSPGFTAITVATLALGIGATTAIFSVVDSVLLRPLKYPNSDRIVTLEPFRSGRQAQVSPANFLDWRQQSRSYEAMAAIFVRGGNLLTNGEPQRIQLSITSAAFFKVFGMEPRLGRGLSGDDEKAGHKPVAVISDGLWQRTFNSDPAAIGESIVVEDHIYEIIGVTPSGFDYPQGTELWLPPNQIVPELNQEIGDPAGVRGLGYLGVIARLNPDVSVLKAQSEIDAINTRLDEEYPDANKAFTARVVTLQNNLVGGIRPVLILLLGAVGSLLLIACANVANLMLARASSRQRELAVRTALGATRFRVIRQMFTESLLFALIGGSCGVLVARGALAALLRLNNKDLPRVNEVQLDWRVLLFALTASCAAGILFGLAPALMVRGVRAFDSLKQGTRAGVRNGGLRHALVVAEIALSLMLLIGAGLLFRSFLSLAQVKPGFVADHVLTFRVAPSGNDYKKTSQQFLFYSNLIDRLRSIPGIQAIGAIDTLPLTAGPQYGFFIQSHPPFNPDTRLGANYRSISSDYFRAMGIPLIEGREFRDEDGQKAASVVIINQALARRDFPNQDPIGQKIGFGAPDPAWAEIVGVVGDVKNDQLNSGTQPEMYVPYAQTTFPAMSFVTRSAKSPSVLSEEIRQAVSALDSRQPVSDFKPIERILSDSVSRPRFNMILLVTFAGIALLLAASGIYGVMSYSVTQQSREIGIRVALGARSADILTAVMGRGLTLSVAGAAIGLAGAFAFSRLMAGLLFGVNSVDPLTYGMVAILLILIAGIASLIPARRAAKVDPASAIRVE